MNFNTVIIGLSGGVDSAVAALMLQQQGFEVHGVFMLNWSMVGEGCNWEWDYESAKRVADHLGIPLDLWNFEEEYRREVLEPFLASFARGETPNPDVACNRHVKFGVFLDRARQEGADWVATGHYASIEAELCESSRELLSRNYAEGELLYRLLAGKDRTKDQSYFLATLSQEQLKYILFPLGKLTKKEVRQIAHTHRLPNAGRKDSYGICFIGEQSMKKFLSSRVPYVKGIMKTVEGERVGEHEGLPFYTIGQRKGIGIGGRGPFYVAAKQVKENTLIMAQGESHPALFMTSAMVRDMHWINGEPPFPYLCKTRHRHLMPLQKSVITRHHNGYMVQFDASQRAVTAGQFLAVYQENVCMGGGTITANL